MSADPVTRLAFCQQEVDRVFGPRFARANPALVAAVMQTAASDWAAMQVACALQNVADALGEHHSGVAMPRPELLRVR